VFIALISTAVHEIGIALLDLLLLSPFADDFPPQYKHIAATGTKNGKSFRTLQVNIELCKCAYEVG
jgi:hypothetical protein